MRSILWVFALSLVLAFTLAPSAKANHLNIVDTAIAANAPGGAYEGQFDTLIAAVLAADEVVVETLSRQGKFTVFAPTDSAFEAVGLNPDNVGDLDQGTLTQILLYHVARGERLSGDVVTAKQIRSLQGGFFFPNMSTTITDAVGRESNIIVVDVIASNGVIHAIDQVLFPFPL